MHRHNARPFHSTFALLAAVVLAAATAYSPAAHAQALSAKELKCASKLGKSAAKLAQTYAKEVGGCIDDAIASGSAAPCPDAASSAKIDSARARVETAVVKTCSSTCSASGGIACVGDLFCPPLGDVAEACTAGAKSDPFDMANLGWPGPYCENAIGGVVGTPEDLAECVATLTTQTSGAMIDTVYGSVDGTSGPSKATGKCLSAIGRASQKLATTIYKGVIKCRSNILKGKRRGDPANCAIADSKLLAKIGKAKNKLRATVDKRCNDAAILAEIDPCGLGVGGAASADDLGDCLVDNVEALTDTQALPVDRAYEGPSLIEATFPPRPVCGDNAVNQGPDGFLPVGEECDGTDDAACPGLCAPPGDFFECTCTDRKRVRYIGDVSKTDLDAGWTGAFHELTIADKATFMTEVSACDCDAMSGPECVGSAGDPVCDHTGVQIPQCEWDLSGTTRCDTHGDGDGKDEASDCARCDAFADNAGDGCSNEGDCQSRCYDAFGNPLGPCDSQADCTSGGQCRGRCDTSQRCLEVPNGAPNPNSSSGIGSCTVTVFRENITGTADSVTGEHAFDMRMFSRVHSGLTSSTPCPVCGGFCDGGSQQGEACYGSCSGNGAPCRSNDECPSAQACSTSSPDCPGSFCNLELVCSGGANDGEPCRVESDAGGFGNVSGDCQPSPGQNLAGDGLRIDWLPWTDAPVVDPGSTPCTAAGFGLFDCPCAPLGGATTRPNACTPACNAGAEFGQGCANGNSSGAFTACAGGTNAGFACDEDSDCPGSSCSTNPLHCTGDPAFERFSCASNADCGLGTCGDACPTGRCVPLCVTDADDLEDGVCAAGPATYHCDGPGETFRLCGQSNAEGDCQAVCSTAGTSCTSDADCPGAERCEGPCVLAGGCGAGLDNELGTGDDITGAGICIPDETNCTLYGIEGGNTANGLGDPTNYKSVSSFCMNATSSAPINESAGLGGPGKIRQSGVNVTNGFTSLP